MEIFCGKGKDVSFDDYMDFINYVFGFSGEQRDFKKLLPKLYRPELKPQNTNYVVTEDAKLRAAVGAYSHEIIVCGEKLKCRGIGNVAVHAYHRSKGYMKACMHAAIADMVSDNIALSTLGGRRQRYNYFGYEKSGTMYNVGFTPDNIRHTFGKDLKPEFTVKEVFRDDAATLDMIDALIKKQDFIPVRSREELFNIMVSWQSRVFAAFDGDRFVGYCIIRDNVAIREILVEKSEDFIKFVLSFWLTVSPGQLLVSVPEFRGDYLEQIFRIGESVDVGFNMTYLVLDYCKVISAFMKLKQTYTTLPDGTFTMLIHGLAGDQNITVSVKDGKSEVKKTDKTPDITLEHLEATRFLFSNVYPLRQSLPGYLREWFPLPIWMYCADEV